MKADIPDKILINRGEDGKLHHSYWTTDQELVPFENTVYIRNDLLLEWAKEQSATCDGSVAMKRAYDKLIDKLNSL